MRSLLLNSAVIQYRLGTLLLRVTAALMEKTIFMIDYGGGFNLNFECSYDELRNVLPPHLEPVKMKILENDSEAKYMLSLYTADLHLKDQKFALVDQSGRTDAFTYVLDEDKKLGLCFISAFVQYPREPFIKSLMKCLNNFFGTDPHDFSLGYPHFDAEEITITDTNFVLKVKDSSMKISGSENITSTGEKFHRDFICANSQIYRGKNGSKNINFFNQDFIDVNVTRWDHETAFEGTGDFASDIHPLCNCKKLVSIQHYRSPNGHNPIRWYFENS